MFCPMEWQTLLHNQHQSRSEIRWCSFTPPLSLYIKHLLVELESFFFSFNRFGTRCGSILQLPEHSAPKHAGPQILDLHIIWMHSNYLTSPHWQPTPLGRHLAQMYRQRSCLYLKKQNRPWLPDLVLYQTQCTSSTLEDYTFNGYATLYIRTGLTPQGEAPRGLPWSCMCCIAWPHSTWDYLDTASYFLDLNKLLGDISGSGPWCCGGRFCEGFLFVASLKGATRGCNSYNNGFNTANNLVDNRFYDYVIIPIMAYGRPWPAPEDGGSCIVLHR